VRHVAIPRKGKPTLARQKVQRSRRFVKLVKWRTGCEARISCLKRDYGWRRTLFDGLAGAQTWCAWGVLTHNSVKIASLINNKTTTTTRNAPPLRAHPTRRRRHPGGEPLEPPEPFAPRFNRRVPIAPNRRRRHRRRPEARGKRQPTGPARRRGEDRSPRHGRLLQREVARPGNALRRP